MLYPIIAKCQVKKRLVPIVYVIAETPISRARGPRCAASVTTPSLSACFSQVIIHLRAEEVQHCLPSVIR